MSYSRNVTHHQKGPTIMNLLCRIIGHKFQNTIVIDEIGDFYNVQDAKYCRLCGEVEQ